MAAGRTDKRTAELNRRYQKQINMYVDGSTVRKLQPETQPEIKQQKTRVSAKTRQNRERALQMNMSYVMFLTVAAVLTVFICINYLKLQATNTALQKNVTALTTRLSETKIENDAEYNRIISSVNLEHVKDVAMNKFGMVYAGSSQIRTYDVVDSDYVKQYQDIPAE